MSQRKIDPRSVALALCLLAAGCSDIYTERREMISLTTGDAIETNKVAQMVDPWPPASANKNIAYNGEKMQGAVERYRTNRVVQPVNATTSSVAYQQAQKDAAGAANAALNVGNPAAQPVTVPSLPGGGWSIPQGAAPAGGNSNNASASAGSSQNP